MTASELLRLLLALTAAGSFGTALVLLVRIPARRHFGAGVGYATWLLVPVALAASRLPASGLAAELRHSVPTLGISTQAVSAASAQLSTPSGGAAVVWLALWLAGAALAAFGMFRAQRRLLRRLGPLTPGTGYFTAQTAVSELPATLGLWPARIVLPHDFEARFDLEQRALVLAHERCHIARGDPWINALAAALRCVFWFNPLFHFAAARLRQDQELACDAAVLAAHPRGRRRYGEALLQAQIADFPAPLGCHFGFGHPLKERIRMLHAAQPSNLRRGTGLIALALAAATLTTAVWAAQDAGPSYQPVKEILASRQNHPPRYPVEAIRDGISGNVVVVADVDEHGRVVGARIEHSEPQGVFDAASLQAVVQWQFEPATRNGLAIREQIRVPITFSVTDEPDDATN